MGKASICIYLFIYLFASTVTKLSIYSEERKCVIFLRKERFRQGRCNVRHSGLGNPVDIPYHLLPSCTFHFKFYSPIVGLWIYHVLEMPGAWIAWNVMMPRYHLANSISWLLPWLWCVAAMERLSFFAFHVAACSLNSCHLFLAYICLLIEFYVVPMLRFLVLSVRFYFVFAGIS